MHIQTCQNRVFAHFGVKLVKLGAQRGDLWRFGLAIGGETPRDELFEKPHHEQNIALALGFVSPVDVGITQRQTELEHFLVFEICVDNGRERFEIFGF